MPKHSLKNLRSECLFCPNLRTKQIHFHLKMTKVCPHPLYLLVTHCCVADVCVQSSGILKKQVPCGLIAKQEDLETLSNCETVFKHYRNVTAMKKHVFLKCASGQSLKRDGVPFKMNARPTGTKHYRSQNLRQIGYNFNLTKF